MTSINIYEHGCVI